MKLAFEMDDNGLLILFFLICSAMFLVVMYSFTHDFFYVGYENQTVLFCNLTVNSSGVYLPVTGLLDKLSNENFLWFNETEIELNHAWKLEDCVTSGCIGWVNDRLECTNLVTEA